MTIVVLSISLAASSNRLLPFLDALALQHRDVIAPSTRNPKKSNAHAIQACSITRKLHATTLSLLPRKSCTECPLHDNVGMPSYRCSPFYTLQFSVHSLGSEITPSLRTGKAVQRKITHASDRKEAIQRMYIQRQQPPD